MKKAVMLLMVLSFLALPVKSYAMPHSFIPVWHHIHLCHIKGAYSKTLWVNGALGWEIVGGAMVALILDNAPAWSVAKDNGTTRAYQQAERFPQQLFDQLPGGTPGRLNP